MVAERFRIADVPSARAARSRLIGDFKDKEILAVLRRHEFSCTEHPKLVAVFFCQRLAHMFDIGHRKKTVGVLTFCQLFYYISLKLHFLLCVGQD